MNLSKTSSELISFFVDQAEVNLNLTEADETSLFIDTNKLIEKKAEELKSVLPDCLKPAVDGLLSIAWGFACDNRSFGIAVGLQMAKEIQDVLSNPVMMYKTTSETYLPAQNAYDTDIDLIDDAIKEARKQCN